jgi:CheY-like chemotaxis protein/anti-sigma regulatory factor (Ser/Thr protein kinase)
MECSALRHHAKADPARLQQVFWNLLSNAHKFTPAGGKITVRTQETDGRLLVEVIDTGIGIAPEILPRIFGAFEQGDSKTARKFGGLGLGLAISKRLVDAHGGRLSAASEGRGTGATFRVELPIVEPLLPSSDRGNASGGEARNLRGLRILLVEDHEGTRQVMGRLLEGLGHLPISAGGVQEALRRAAGGRFDLVIGDLGLPDGSGHELMRELAARYGLTGIALSGFGMEDDVRRSHEAGFAEHLTKPVDVAKLEATIERVAETLVQKSVP